MRRPSPVETGLDDQLLNHGTHRLVLRESQGERNMTITNNKSLENRITRSRDSSAEDKAVFEDILLHSSAGQRSRRKLATAASFLLELLLIGIVLVLPLWFTEVLPMQQFLSYLEAPPPPPPPSPAPVKIVKAASNIINGQLRTPTRIPREIQMIKEDDSPPPVGAIVGGVPGGTPGGQLGGAIDAIIGSGVSAVPSLPKPVRGAQPVRVSQGVIKGLLINRVEPKYPIVARQARIEGVVVLTAIIGKDGSVQSLHVVSGHPLLAQAAITAVRQWQYKPYILNGKPVEIETEITVMFRTHT